MNTERLHSKHIQWVLQLCARVSVQTFPLKLSTANDFVQVIMWQAKLFTNNNTNTNDRCISTQLYMHSFGAKKLIQKFSGQLYHRIDTIGTRFIARKEH